MTPTDAARILATHLQAAIQFPFAGDDAMVMWPAEGCGKLVIRSRHIHIGQVLILLSQETKQTLLEACETILGDPAHSDSTDPNQQSEVNIKCQK